MKDMQITLYDIFGYLGPGVIAFAGIYLAVWGLILDNTQDWSKLTTAGWIAILVVAYLIGHVVQALSNTITKIIRINPEVRILGDAQAVTPEILALVNERACRILGLQNDTSLTLKVLYDVVDHYLLQHGKTESREIYVYREGFYRGLSVALLVFALGSFFRTIGSNGNLEIFGISISITRKVLVTCTIFSTIMAALAIYRFNRFSYYRVKNSIYSFIAITKPEDSTESRGL